MRNDRGAARRDHSAKPAARQRSEAGAAAKRTISKKRLSSGVVHRVPADLRAALVASPAAHAGWEDITPLARNEWICWTQSVKKAETRKQHIERACHDLAKGKRRPCCWPGCPHR